MNKTQKAISWRWFALIQGGIGPDVWDKDLEINAIDFQDAANQARAWAEIHGGEVYSVEQWYLGSPRAKTITELKVLCRRAHSELDKLMGDTDLPNDDSELMRLMIQLAVLEETQ